MTAESTADPIEELQSRLNDLELSKAHNDVATILQKERAEMLLSLRKIKETMKSEAGGGGGGGASNKELEKLKAENKELKKVNAKQQYRIQHLVHNFRESIEGKGEKQ